MLRRNGPMSLDAIAAPLPYSTHTAAALMQRHGIAWQSRKPNFVGGYWFDDEPLSRVQEIDCSKWWYVLDWTGATE